MTHPLVAAARAYMDVPFAHQGRSRTGMDCAGLALLALRDCGYAPADIPAYGRTPWRDGLQAAIEAFYGAPVAGEPEPGDLLLMRIDGAEPQHIAIVGDYIGGGLSLIHTRADARKRVTEHRLCNKWRSRIVAIYRMPA